MGKCGKSVADRETPKELSVLRFAFVIVESAAIATEVSRFLKIYGEGDEVK